MVQYVLLFNSVTSSAFLGVNGAAWQLEEGPRRWNTPTRLVLRIKLQLCVIYLDSSSAASAFWFRFYFWMLVCLGDVLFQFYEQRRTFLIQTPAPLNHSDSWLPLKVESGITTYLCCLQVHSEDCCFVICLQLVQNVLGTFTTHRYLLSFFFFAHCSCCNDPISLTRSVNWHLIFYVFACIHWSSFLCLTVTVFLIWSLGCKLSANNSELGFSRGRLSRPGFITKTWQNSPKRCMTQWLIKIFFFLMLMNWELYRVEERDRARESEIETAWRRGSLCISPGLFNLSRQSRLSNWIYKIFQIISLYPF